MFIFAFNESMDGGCGLDVESVGASVIELEALESFLTQRLNWLYKMSGTCFLGFAIMLMVSG